MRKPVFIPFVFLATAVFAQSEVVSTVQGWDIRADTNMTCFATRAFDDGNTVYMGFEPGGAGGYFAIYNAAWTHIEDGQQGLVEFDFGQEKFAGEAVGKFRDGVPGGYAKFDNPAFAEAIARYDTVQIAGSKGATYAMSLTGTHKAVAAVQACQMEQPELSSGASE